MKVLALDVSTTTTGFSVIDSKQKLIEYGQFTIKDRRIFSEDSPDTDEKEDKKKPTSKKTKEQTLEKEDKEQAQTDTSGEAVAEDIAAEEEPEAESGSSVETAEDEVETPDDNAADDSEEAASVDEDAETPERPDEKAGQLLDPGPGDKTE